MKYNILGKTGLKVSRIGFGGGALKPCSAEQCYNLLEIASKNGINYLDLDKTFDESKLNNFFKKKNNFVIACKSDAKDYEGMKKDVEDSLEKLGVDFIDIYQFHLVVSEEDLEKRMHGALVALKELKQQGKIKFIGITGHEISVLFKAIETGEFDTVLVPYNLGHMLGKDVIIKAKEKKVGVLSMKPLGGGFLIDPKLGPERKPGSEVLTAKNALDFVLSNDLIDCVLVGMNELKELNEILEIEKIHIKLSTKESEKLNKQVFSFLGDDYCRNCKYCLPCVFDGINSVHSLEINEILKLHGYYFKYGYKDYTIEAYNKLKGNVGQCEGCTVCETKCPYEIPILKHFKELEDVTGNKDNKNKIKNNSSSQTLVQIGDMKNTKFEEQKIKTDFKKESEELKKIIKKNESLLKITDIEIKTDKKTSMKYRRLGRTNLFVSEIGFGCGPFRGLEFSQDDLLELINYAVSKGINFVETAKDYDQTKIQKAIKKHRNKLILASKTTSFSKKQVLLDIKEALELYNTDYIDIYQLHSVNTIDDLNLRIKNGALDALIEAKKKGWIKFIGISGHYMEIIDKAIDTNKFDVIQIPYNLGHQKAEELFEKTHKKDIGVIVMKPLGGGILIDPKTGPEEPKPEAKDMNVKNALGFILSNPFISTALIGMREKKQISENYNVVKNRTHFFSKDEKITILENVRNLLGEDYCRTCKYCMPCDVNGWEFGIDNFLRIFDYYTKYGYSTYRKEYNKLKIKADKCVSCGLCETKCPYNIPIREKLKKVHALLKDD